MRKLAEIQICPLLPFSALHRINLSEKTSFVTPGVRAMFLSTLVFFLRIHL